MQKGGRECPFTYVQFSGCGHKLSPAHRERRPVVLTQPDHTRGGEKRGKGRGVMTARDVIHCKCERGSDRVRVNKPWSEERVQR